MSNSLFFLLFCTISLLASLKASAQNDTSISESDHVPNSFDLIYKKRNPTLTYKYDSVDQIHDYSGNWDFDLDGKKDGLLFVGTGGAHLYYYLRIILSSDSIVKNFSFIMSDFPALPPEQKLNEMDYNPLKTFTSFAVFDGDGDSFPDIYLHLDKQIMSAGQKQLREPGISTNDILITFKNKKIKFNNYSSL